MAAEVTPSTARIRSDPIEVRRWLCRQMRAAEDDGYFGPRSAIWRLHREAVLGLGLGRALLLQVAHPWVAQAVADYSTFRDRPLDRLLATVIAAELLVFGSRRQADEAAARVRGVHDRIVGTLREDVGIWRAGTPYRAGDPAALLWVVVTLIDTTLRVYEASFGRLPEATVRAYLADAARLGEMLGVPAALVSRDRATLTQYLAAMIASGTVAVGPQAREIAAALLQARVMPGTSWRVYSAATHAVAAATLPPALRMQYGALLAVRRRHLWRAGALAGKAVLPWLPERVRLDPIAAIAVGRAS